MKDLRTKIAEVINAVSAENGSDTPDWILADYLVDCLNAFDRAVNIRERWYSRISKEIVAPECIRPFAPIPPDPPATRHIKEGIPPPPAPPLRHLKESER